MTSDFTGINKYLTLIAVVLFGLWLLQDIIAWVGGPTHPHRLYHTQDGHSFWAAFGVTALFFYVFAHDAYAVWVGK